MEHKKNNTTPIEKVIEIVRHYSAQQWADWIDDIFAYNLAYPYSRLSNQGDVLEDNIAFLKKHDIPAKNYEIAIIEKINEYTGEISTKRLLFF